MFRFTSKIHRTIRAYNGETYMYKETSPFNLKYQLSIRQSHLKCNYFISIGFYASTNACQIGFFGMWTFLYIYIFGVTSILNLKWYIYKKETVVYTRNCISHKRYILYFITFLFFFSKIFPWIVYDGSRNDFFPTWSISYFY